MNQTAPPSLPPGWIALWDETSQRYYYLEQATGLTQWDVPTADSKHTQNISRGEANSYSSNFSSQGGGYPSYEQQQQQQQQPGSYTTQPTVEGDQQDRGLGKIMHGFSGGAITGSLIGFAAGKLLGNNNKHSSGSNHGYGPPPPQYGGGYNYGPPPGNYYGGNPPAPHAPYGSHGSHGSHGNGHHGHHGHHNHHNHGW